MVMSIGLAQVQIRSFQNPSRASTAAFGPPRIIPDHARAAQAAPPDVPLNAMGSKSSGWFENSSARTPAAKAAWLPPP
jgi:hypothetical protein